MTELEAVKRELAELRDAYTKQTKTLNDLLMNLDFDNMPQVKKSIMRYVNGTNEALSEIQQSVDDNGAAIALVTQKITRVEADVNETTTQLKQESDANAAKIQLVAKSVTETREALSDEIDEANEAIGDMQQDIADNAKGIKTVTEATAQIQQTATDNAARIALIVKTTTTADGKTVSYVDGGIIIEAINNDKSQVTISGDKINIEGVASFVTREELANGGSGTVINGGLIQTDTLDVNSIKTNRDQGFLGVDFNTAINVMAGDLSMVTCYNLADPMYGIRMARFGFVTFDGGKYGGMESNHPMLIRTGPGQQIIIAAGLGGTAMAPTHNAAINLYGSALFFNGRLIAS